MSCGCKKQKTPEPLRPVVKITENQSGSKSGPDRSLSAQEAELLKRINEKLKNG